MGSTIDAAVEVAAYLESRRRHDTPFWHSSEADDPKPNTRMYNGAGGIILFLLELASATGEQRYYDEAVAAGAALADLAPIPRQSVNMNIGSSADLIVFDALATATGDPRFGVAVDQTIAMMAAAATEMDGGVGWIEPVPFSQITGVTGQCEPIDLSVGSAGLAMTLASISDRYPTALPLAEAAAGRLLHVGEGVDDGIRWEMTVEMPFPFPAPGMAHGSAGVALMFAELYRVTGKQDYLDAAIGGASYAWSHHRSTGDGCLIPHLLGVEPPRYYLANCHGPAGTTRLFTVLAEITGDAAWNERAAALLAGMNDLGAPEQRSEGLWQNYGQCCGDAGVGDFALWRYQRSADPTDLALADRAAAVILDASIVEDGKRSWLMAEHRDRPDFVQRQTGYFQGAAGIGSFLVHLDAAHGGTGERIWLPDYPRPA